MCSGRRYGSNDMQHALFGSGHDLASKGQIFIMTFQGHIIYQSTRLDKRNTMLAKKCCVFSESKVITEKRYSQKNGYFLVFFSLEAKPLTLDQIWGHVSERTLKELSNTILHSTVALLVPQLCASLSKNVEIDQIWHLVTWPLTWPKTWPK